VRKPFPSLTHSKKKDKTYEKEVCVIVKKNFTRKQKDSNIGYGTKTLK
jgi:hypothetical protein